METEGNSVCWEMCSTLELQAQMNNEVINLEIEKISNVAGKLYRRKRWKARNGLGFVRFMYESQVAYARVCGRDFFIEVMQFLFLFLNDLI